MNKSSLFDRDGYVKLPPKVGDEPYKPRKSDPQAEIEFCTHCKKSECKHGNCKHIKKFRQEMKEEDNNV